MVKIEHWWICRMKDASKNSFIYIIFHVEEHGNITRTHTCGWCWCWCYTRRKLHIIETQGLHIVFRAHKIPSLSWAKVILISHCILFNISSNGFRISTLSRIIIQPPGRNIRSISTTMVTGCLHLQKNCFKNMSWKQFDHKSHLAGASFKVHIKWNMQVIFSM